MSNRAILAVRLFGFVLAGEFDVVYLREFLLARIVTPVAAIVIGALLWALSRPLGRLLGRGLE